MKSFIKKISIIFLMAMMINLIGCKSTEQSNQNDPDIKTLQETVQQLSTSLQPNVEQITDVIEGAVPPHNQNTTMYYYVQSGDTLSKIAKKIYGERSAWKKIATENNLKDPNHIYAGDILHYELSKPTKSFAEAYENAPRAKIIAKKGDSLARISKAIFGKSADWRVLWKENPEIANPDKIREGQEIYFRPKALKNNTEVAFGNVGKSNNEVINE